MGQTTPFDNIEDCLLAAQTPRRHGRPQRGGQTKPPCRAEVRTRDSHLETKLTKSEFRNDLKILSRRPPDGYNLDVAAHMIASTVSAGLSDVS
jgi:hypothetical protein